MKSAFWDTSSLVPLCVHQQASAAARRLAKQYGIVVWWCTPVEARSAFARMLRAGDLNQAELILAEASLQRLEDGWHELLPDDSMRTEAGALLNRFPLSAADAFQLAAGLSWARGYPRGKVFICGDARLLEAARQLGFQGIEA